MVYRNGFASQKSISHVVAEDAGGKLYERYFRGDAQGAQIAEWLTKQHLTQIDLQKSVEPEPVSHALFLVKREIEKIKQAVAKQYGKRFSSEILLSGPGNYRCVLAKQRPYKGNRDPEHKPYHYQAIRDYLVDSWGARVVHGREADDEVSILAHRARLAKGKAIVATIDKDLDQIPGPHFNYRENVFYDVTEEDAKRWFWVQCIAGDATDNIPGMPGWGVAKAKEFLEDIKPDATDADIWYGIERLYETKGLGPEVALETAQLVYIQQRENELWMPPGVPMGTIPSQSIDD